MRRRPKRSNVAVPESPRIFSALLKPKPRFAGFGKSTILACSVYATLLWSALSLPSTHAAQPKEEPELSVSLLELPRAPEPAIAEESGPAPAGEPAAVAAAEPTVRKVRPRPVVAAQPAPIEKPSEVAPKVDPKELAPKIETPAPVEQPKIAPQPMVSNTPAAAPSSASGGSAGPISAPGGTGNGGIAGGTANGTGTGGNGKAAGGGGNLVIMPFGDGMTRPTLISKADPIYTREALSARVEGLLIAKCVITTSGELTRCRVVKGLPHMDNAVLSALAKWRYSPVLYQGKPTSVEYVISVRLVPP